MNKIILAAVTALFAVGVYAQTPAPAKAEAPVKPAVTAPAPKAETPTVGDCEAKAVSKSGKPLTGAAKTSSIKKCEGASKEAGASGCAAKAVGKNGKPLAGAAKSSFMKKCEAGK